MIFPVHEGAAQTTHARKTGSWRVRNHWIPLSGGSESGTSFGRQAILAGCCLGHSEGANDGEEHSSHLRVYKLNSRQPPETFMTAKDLSALFLDTLKDIYYAEKQIYKALPKMAKAANSTQLRAAFEKHHDETEGQIERLEQIFELMGKPARGKKCDAIEGILDEGTEIMGEYKGEPALDAGLLAAAQAVEHYEISRYGTLKTWAAKLGMKDAVKLLDQTLAEEKKTDEALTQLADKAVNAEAA
jgi:ferritin-like metal-binding protein YciE